MAVKQLVVQGCWREGSEGACGVGAWADGAHVPLEGALVRVLLASSCRGGMGRTPPHPPRPSPSASSSSLTHDALHGLLLGGGACAECPCRSHSCLAPILSGPFQRPLSATPTPGTTGTTSFCQASLLPSMPCPHWASAGLVAWTCGATPRPLIHAHQFALFLGGRHALVCSRPR